MMRSNKAVVSACVLVLGLIAPLIGIQAVRGQGGWNYTCVPSANTQCNNCSYTDSYCSAQVTPRSLSGDAS
jgi:hypothetical protein